MDDFCVLTFVSDISIFDFKDISIFSDVQKTHR